MSDHANISIFVPHMGCPHRCSFCDQHTITGQQAVPTADTVRQAVETALQSRFGGAKRAELAFFGGSFTAIDRVNMVALLEAAAPYVKDGSVAGIRISTRPDAVDEEVLDILKACGVTAIELGAQSMEDRVLAKNHRGHTAADVAKAAHLIKAAGFELGLQMMTGLYGDTAEGAVMTAEELVALNPDTVRIYPTVVLKNTHLAKLVESGVFVSDTLEDTVELCAKLLQFFEEKSIPVIRLGLHELEEENIVCGPWHPALRELCQGRIYLEKFITALKGKAPGDYIFTVGRGERSKATGQKRVNLEHLAKMGYRVKIQEREGIEPFSFKMEGGNVFAAEIH